MSVTAISGSVQGNAAGSSAGNTARIAPRIALCGDLLDFTGTPGWGEIDSPAVRLRPDHWLLIEGNRIQGVQREAPDDGWQQHDHRGRLILPGFIDTHVHMPQLDVIASYGTELLDWLNTYTFPAEMRFADAERSCQGSALFCDALLANGTTSAVVFATAHKVSAHELFGAAQARGMRLITGKVLQDRHSPDGLRDDVVQAERDCIELIERWHGVDRLAYAVTVRFAPTSTPEQLAMAGGLCAADPSLYMQTHVAENRDEVKWVRELFPEARSYLDVYARHRLLHSRSVLAHGIWIDAADRALLRETQAQIAHSPSSNLFLGSGLFDWNAAVATQMPVSLASDVGGGTSLSLVRTMADAYKVQAMAGQRLTAWKALHAATLGSAEALGLSDEIGSFEPGRMADVCVWDWAADPVAARRMEVTSTPHERAFAWITLADDRNLAQTWVAGQLRYARPPRSAATQ